MHLSINKKKIYFYLFTFVFINTLFNINQISKFSNIFKLEYININGLNVDEENLLRNDLELFKNQNIFLIKNNHIYSILDDFKQIESFKIKKIFPSKLNIDVKKTTYIGKTMKNGKVYFIGNNKKFIEQKKINIQPNVPFVFGNFSIEEFLILQNNLKDNNFNLDEFKSYYYYKNGRWDLNKKDNITIKLPFTNDEQSLKQYKILEDEGKIYKNSIVDLRVPKKIIISYE
jgi:cell division septal protein FtsQ